MAAVGAPASRALNTVRGVWYTDGEAMVTEGQGYVSLRLTAGGGGDVCVIGGVA
jgi:hypothetical protein